MTVPSPCRSVVRSTASAPFFSSRNAKLAHLARLVLTTWLCPLMLSMVMTLFVASAHAQQTTAPSGIPPATPPQPTVVLDFTVPAGVDAVVGRKAADALAVELANSRSYTVIPRETVDTKIANTAGLTPPYNTSTQASLARAVGARTVFSGRVMGVQVTPGRQARVQIDVRQLEASTEDYINGTTISEVSEVKLQNTPSEVLVDEAINKAAISAVRSLAQIFLPRGVVLNVGSDHLITLNIGSRNGVQAGQRYTLLRDIFNKATNVTTRVKIGEVRVSSVEADQSTAVLSAGGQGGVTTGDYVRRIYEFTNIPITAGSDGSVTQSPVTAPPPSYGPGIVKKSKKGALGLVGLLVAVALFGLGGGGSGGSSSASPQDVTAYRNIPSDPSHGPTNPNRLTGNIVVTYTSGASGLTTQSSDIAGYFIYRANGVQPSGDATELQGFVPGNTRTFSDNAQVTLNRTVQINTGSGPNSPYQIQTNSSNPAPANSVGNTTIGSSDNTVNATFQQEPAYSGNQFFYAVQRVTVIEEINNGTGNSSGNGTGGGTGNNSGGVTLRLTLSNISNSSKGVTAVAGPRVVPSDSNFDLTDFQIAIIGDAAVNGTVDGAQPQPTPTGTPAATTFRLPLYDAVTEFQIQVSKNSTFKKGSFTAPVVGKPLSTNGNGNFILVVDHTISVPNYTSGQLFVRVGGRNRSDEPGGRTPFVFGPIQGFTPVSSSPAAPTSKGFLTDNGGSRSDSGIGLPGLSSTLRRRGGDQVGPGRILRPR